jgi:hypothetical protein
VGAICECFRFFVSFFVLDLVAENVKSNCGGEQTVEVNECLAYLIPLLSVAATFDVIL